MAVTTQTATVNGVNVDALNQTIDSIRATPGLAKFRFSLKNQWIDCGRNRSTLKDFYGAGENQRRREPFTLDADEPPVLLGQDSAPNPVEYLLEALVSCVTSSMIYHAAARGIKVNAVESEVEGDIDLRGFLGLDKTIRNGYQNLRIKFKIDADCSDEQLQELVKLGPTFSPVLDSIKNGVPITVTGIRK